MSAEEIKLYKAELEKEKKYGFSRWGVFGWVEKLAGGDITKFDAVCEQPFIVCLNLLSYWKERDELIERERKRQEQNKI